jgi:CheY-like chemotaxis protein/anti-sigma regulatory factor (Ser/Thr protein kinase)
MKAQAKGVRMLSNLAPGVATALIGDPTRLRQILLNLLSNAVKFTDVGEVVLTVRNSASGKPGQIEFTVSDTGIGIPPGKLETIFDDFAQADASTTRKYGGTGLGLGISRRLVEAMGGSLTVTSEAGRGSRFSFAIQFDPRPVTTREVRLQAAPSPDGKAAEPVRPAKILVGDDSPDSRLLIEAYLQSSPYVLTFEEDGLAVVDRFAASDFDLILMDVHMPVMDGLAAARAIRVLERESGAVPIPIVALTADASLQDVERSGNAGCNAHLSKPISKAAVLRAIEKFRRAPGPAEATPSSAGRYNPLNSVAGP